MLADAVAVGAAFVLAVLVIVIVGMDALVRLVARLFAAPGVVVHEFAHKQACDLVGVPVVEVVYFSFGNPPGYVRHGQPRRYRASFAISVAPFLVNTVVSLAAFFGVATLLFSNGIGVALEAGDAASVASAALAELGAASSETLALAAVLGWLGLSIGMGAFPSTGDANTLWARSRAEWRRSPIVLLGVPVVAVIYLVNLLSRLWADVFYALALAVAAFYAVGPIGI